mgnify:CR=1 FL=1
MLGQDTTRCPCFSPCVNVEVYATLRFIERNAYKSFGIDYSFHHSCFLLSANIHHSFIKMAYIPVFKGIETLGYPFELCTRKIYKHNIMNEKSNYSVGTQVPP